MKIKWIKNVLFILIPFTSLILMLCTRENADNQGIASLTFSTLADIELREKQLYAIDDRNGVVYRINPETGAMLDRKEITKGITSIKLDASGIFVTGNLNRRIYHLDATALKINDSLECSPYPTDVLVNNNENYIAVSGFGKNTIDFISTSSNKIIKSIHGVYKPYFLTLSPDKKTILAGSLIPEKRADSLNTASCITIIDATEMKSIKKISFPEGSLNIRGISISSDNNYAYVLHNIGRVALPTSQMDRGWIMTNAMTIIDIQKQNRYATILLDNIYQGAANPWGIVLSPDNSKAYITISGSNEIMKIELAALHRFLKGEKFESLNPYLGKHHEMPGEDAFDDFSGTANLMWEKIKQEPKNIDLLAYDLTTMYGSGIITRKKIPVTNPRSIEISEDGNTLYVAGYYSGNIAVVNARTMDTERVIEIATNNQLTSAQRGELLFYDAGKCFQTWLSCASCHPNVRADGLNWDLMNDGVGNHKNTKSLLQVNQTPPMMWHGVRNDYKHAILKGFEVIQYSYASEQEVNDVAAFFQSLEPLPSPWLDYKNGKYNLTADAQKGKEIFYSNKTSCARCHSGDLYTDLKQYDVGTANPSDRIKTFDVPSLVEVWNTAPYLHDGSAATMMEVLKDKNKNDEHGYTSHLSNDELSWLVEYINSL